MRRHGAVWPVEAGFSEDIPDAGARHSEPRHVLAGVPAARSTELPHLVHRLIAQILGLGGFIPLLAGVVMYAAPEPLGFPLVHSAPISLVPGEARSQMSEFLREVTRLSPQNETQQFLKTQALRITANFAQARFQMYVHGTSELPRFSW